MATPSVAPRCPKRSAAHDQDREDEVHHRTRAPGGEVGQAEGRGQEHHGLEPAAARPRPRQRPVPGERERHDEQRARGVSEPPRPPDRGHLVKRDHPTREQRGRADRRADRGSRGDRDGDCTDAANARERRAVPNESAQKQGRDQNLEHVPAGLAERRAERQDRVLVGKQVADQEAGPVGDPAQVEEGDAHADGQPDNGGDRARELQQVPGLGAGVVEASEGEHAGHIPRRRVGKAIEQRSVGGLGPIDDLRHQPSWPIR